MTQVSPAVSASALSALAERLWELPGQGLVQVGLDRLPPSHVPVEEYAAIGRGRPLYLFPTGQPAAVRAGLTRHLSTTSARARAAAAGLAAAWSLPAARRALTRHRVLVGIDASVPREDWPELLLLQRLAADLDVEQVHAIIPIRRQTPNAKPTARIFLPDGTALGYAKQGWSAATSDLVDTEATALRDLAGGPPGLTTPKVASWRRWATGSYLLAEPLPGGLQPWSGSPDVAAAQLRAVAESAGPLGRSEVGSSPYVTGLRHRLAGAATDVPAEAEALLRWLDRVLATHGGVEIELGRWHGDWVPWNVARRGERRYAWDWEYSATSVPLGFDVVHWHFQGALADPAATLVSAAPAARAALPDLARLEIPPAARPVVESLYLLEILTRAVGLAAHGAGWNPKLRPHLVAFADSRRD